MNLYSIYFSPTGNSKLAANIIALERKFFFEEFDVTTVSVEKEFNSEEYVIFSAPVYGGRLPALAAERFKKFKGNDTKAIICVTYGNRDYDDALLELKDICTAQGFKVVAAAAVVGKHTYGQIAVDRPDQDDCDQILEFAKKAFEKTEALNTVPGNFPYVDEFKRGRFYPLTSDLCNGCGICKAECPAHAIKDDFKVDGDICISCFRCIDQCPVGAKNMDTEEYQQFAEMFTEKLKEKKENVFFL